MTAEADHEHLIKALCRLAPYVRPSERREWRREPAVRVIDCILSLNRNYCRFVVPRLDCFEQNFPEVRSVRELCTKIATYSSAHKFVETALKYSHEARAVTLANVANWLAAVAGNGTSDEQLEELEFWARTSSYDGYRAFLIPGFGLGGFQYMRMLFGANTTKPDIRICEWTAKAVGHPVSPSLALRLLEQAAPAARVCLRDVDTTIWENWEKL
jgi:hypothetical protein